MGPLFNPVYWILGLVYLAIAAAVAAGLRMLVVSLRQRFRYGDEPWWIGPSTTAVSVLAFLLVFCGLCSWSFDGTPAPQCKPSENDLAGEWVPTGASLARMREAGYTVSVHSLAFNEDGTFVMTNMPDWWLDANGDASGGFYSGSGMWQLVKGGSGERWRVYLYFITLSGNETNLIAYALVGGDRPPCRLHFSLGDPDAGRTMIFEKH